MAFSDIQRLRQQSLMGGYDQLTPEMGGMGDYQPFYQPMRDVGPTFDVGQSIKPGIDPATPTGLNQVANTQLANVQVNPNQSIDATIDAINRVYSPEYASRDRLNTLLDNAPVRNDPNWARKLTASAISWGSRDKDPIGTMEKIMHAPYLRDQADWQARAEPFYKAAELENRGNINERTLAGNVVVAQTQADRLAQQERIANQKNEVAMIRARAYDAKNRGMEIREVGDRLVGIHPDGRRQDLGPSGALSEADRIDLQGDWRVRAAREYGEAAADRTVLAGADVYNSPQGPVSVNPRDPDQQMPQGPLTRPGVPPRPVAENPDWVEKGRQNKLRELYDTDPEAREFIKSTDGGRTFRLVPPTGSSGLFGIGARPVDPTKEAAYNRTRDKVYPRTSNIGPSTDIIPEQQPLGQEQARMPRAQQEAEIAAGKRVKVISPDGKEGTIPAQNVAAARAAGYIIVGSK